MKKILFCLTLTIAVSASAQNYKSQSKNTIEVNVNLQTGSSPISFDAPNLRYRRFIKENLAIRTLVAVSTFSNTDQIQSGSPEYYGTSTQTNWNFNLGLGIEKHLLTTEKLDPYLGGQLMFATGGGSFSGSNTINGFTYLSGGEFQNSISGGFGLGLMAVLGADYYFAQNLYLGTEISFGYTYQFNGYQQNWNNLSQTTTETKLSTTHGLGIAINPGVRIGIRF